MKLEKLDHFGLEVRDLQRAERFYVDVLGLSIGGPLRRSNPDGLRGQNLALFEVAAASANRRRACANHRASARPRSSCVSGRPRGLSRRRARLSKPAWKPRADRLGRSRLHVLSRFGWKPARDRQLSMSPGFIFRSARCGAFAILLLVLPVPALAEQHFRIDLDASEITAAVAEPMSSLRGDAVGKFRLLSCDIYQDPKRRPEDGANIWVEAVIDAASYHSNSATRDNCGEDLDPRCEGLSLPSVSRAARPGPTSSTLPRPLGFRDAQGRADDAWRGPSLRSSGAGFAHRATS